MFIYWTMATCLNFARTKREFSLEFSHWLVAQAMDLKENAFRQMSILPLFFILFFKLVFIFFNL